MTKPIRKQEHVSQYRASDSVSNPVDARNFSLLWLCGREICPKVMFNMGWVYTILTKF